MSRVTKLTIQKMKETKISDMDRPELIDRLRRHMNPLQYRKILAWQTENIRQLLRHYEELDAVPAMAM